MFDPTCLVLQGIIEDGSCYSQRRDADVAYTYLKSFEFVFILHLIKEILGRTDLISQALQKKSQDILNAIELVSATNEILNDFRNNKWLCLLEEVKMFCKKHKIYMLDMHASYNSGRYRPRGQDNHVNFVHHYKVDVFICILDKQLQKLTNRFGDNVMELLTLAFSLVPSNDSRAFNVDEICLLVEKYYPEDFTEQERVNLRYQLEMFKVEEPKNQILSGVSSIAQLCTSLEKTKKYETYHLLSRLIRLLLTLSVSTATTKKGFSAMKLCKTRLRNKMADDFLANILVVYIEKEFAEKIDSESVIKEFKSIKGRRAEL